MVTKKVLQYSSYSTYNVAKAYINYTQIDNVNRLHNRIEPFAALFWALVIVLAHILQ